MLRNRLFLVALSVSALFHLSMVTLFSIVFEFPVQRIDYYSFSILSEGPAFSSEADITNNLFESKLSDDSINFAVGKDSGTFTIKLGTAPASKSATGTAGTVIIAADGIYLCKETDTWVKTELATWN